MMGPLSVTVISSLISGLLGVLVSSWFYERLETKRFKRETVRRLLGSRYDISGDNFRTALNELPVVFSDSRRVMDALQAFWDEIQRPDKKEADAKLARLLRAACIEVGVTHKGVEEQYYLRYFSAQPGAPADGARPAGSHRR